MARKPQKPLLSFFKIISRHDFTRLLRLPMAFMRKYGPNFPKKVILRIELGRKWEVKVEKMEDGHLCFSRGWDVFSKDVTLKFGEFLVFEMDDDDRCTFHVSVFETSGCNKEFLYDDDGSHDEEEDGEDDGDDDEYDGENDDDDEDEYDDVGRRPHRGMRSYCNPLYYEFELKPSNKYIITLRRQFTRAAGLMGKEGVKVVGKHHSVFVTLKNASNDNNRLDLGPGWYDFLQVNALVFGKTYSIEFIPNKNLIQIKELAK